MLFERGIAVLKKFFSKLAAPFVFSLLLTALLSSCSKAESLYLRGNYQGAINKIDRLPNPTAEDYLLKARSYLELGEGEKAMQSLVLYLSLSEDASSEDRAFAVSNFIRYNTSDRLSVLLLRPEDGLEAQTVLYKAYQAQGDLDRAKSVLEGMPLSRYDSFSLMLEHPVDAQYMLGELVKWYSSITDEEKPDFLECIVRLSSDVEMTEVEAKQFLTLTDVLMEDAFFIADDIRLSALLKTKGNILEKLYDKVNARIYWTQAYRLNPEDEELSERVK